MSSRVGLGTAYDLQSLIFGWNWLDEVSAFFHSKVYVGMKCQMYSGPICAFLWQAYVLTLCKQQAELQLGSWKKQANSISNTPAQAYELT